ncbi:unnamed protein product [Coccothraustes coccothraustes]
MPAAFGGGCDGEAAGSSVADDAGGPVATTRGGQDATVLPGPVSGVPGPAGLCLSWSSSIGSLCPGAAQPTLARAGDDPDLGDLGLVGACATSQIQIGLRHSRDEGDGRALSSVMLRWWK